MDDSKLGPVKNTVLSSEEVLPPVAPQSALVAFVRQHPVFIRWTVVTFFAGLAGWLFQNFLTTRSVGWMLASYFFLVTFTLCAIIASVAFAYGLPRLRKTVAISISAAVLLSAVIFNQLKQPPTVANSGHSATLTAQVVTTPPVTVKIPDDMPKNPTPPKEEKKQPHSPKQPEISLRFVDPKSPAVLLVNDSNVIARDIKWGVILWDRNSKDPIALPIPHPPLWPWIKPGFRGGPQDIFNVVQSRIKTGDMIFGTAYVDCPDCAKGKTYLVSIDYGHGGWFVEVIDPKSGSPAWPNSFDLQGEEAYYEFINNIPTKKRIPITSQ